MPRIAEASTAFELSVSDLVHQSERCVVGTAVAHRSEWAYVGDGRRIVTWTRVLQEQEWLNDSEQEDELEILTLGGQIGSLLQKVSGEASLPQGGRAVLFLGSEYATSRRVIGMAQGHFPVNIEEDDQLRTVVHRSPTLPHLLPRIRSHGRKLSPRAIDALHGLSLEKAKTLVRGNR